MLDVAVVGGGPAGSEVARRLAKSGKKVAVLEKRNDFHRTVCCTGIVSLECIQRFDIPDSLIRRSFDKAIFFSPSENSIELSYPKSLACLLDRASFDEFMFQRADRAGANCRLGQEVESVEVKNDKVVLSGQSNNEKFVTEAKAVVLATGAVSHLVNKAGLGNISDPVVGAQCEVETTSLDKIEIYTGNEVAPGFFAWLVPITPGKALAGLMTRGPTKAFAEKFLSKLESSGRISSDKVKINLRPITQYSRGRTFGDRLILVGGSAGQVKPTTGGGIYFALICADIAARILDNCLNDDSLTAAGLRGYEREWKAVLGRELGYGEMARRFYQSLNDERIEQLFRLAESSDIASVLFRTPDVSFDWHSKTIKTIMSHALTTNKLNEPVNYAGNSL